MQRVPAVKMMRIVSKQGTNLELGNATVISENNGKPPYQGTL